MTPLEIQFELKKREITQKEIAEQLNVTEMMVSLVIRGQSISDRIMKAISDKLGEDHRIVFPKYYLSKKQRQKALKSA